MKLAATLLHEVRESAGLSRGCLARRAGVATSTVSRVEDGDSDPTIEMLHRLVAAGGCDLRLEAAPIARGSIAALTDIWPAGARSNEIDWTRLRAFLDRLDRHPSRLAEAIDTPPARNHPQVDNLLAGVAEKVADDGGCLRPRWTATVDPLQAPWYPISTPAMRKQITAHTPPQLSARRMFVAEGDLWRRSSGG
jgi:transcriptional regulator with XRE-family HTH domain